MEHIGILIVAAVMVSKSFSPTMYALTLFTCHHPVFSLSLHLGLVARTSLDVAIVKEILLEA